jgi:hypothetical protein
MSLQIFWASFYEKEKKGSIFDNLDQCFSNFFARGFIYLSGRDHLLCFSLFSDVCIILKPYLGLKKKQKYFCAAG